MIFSTYSFSVFLSTPSARRATASGLVTPHAPFNFYPRPPRGGRQAGHHRDLPPDGISIHALREEGDAAGVGSGAGFDPFLSTPSARRATSAAESFDGLWKISIHALREEGDC